MNKYSELKVTKVGDKWRVLEDYVTPFGTVTKGSVSNGASIPRVFWSIIHPTGQLFEASVLHDYLYDNAINNKQFADLAFYNTMLYYGVNKLIAKPSYWLVRLRGKGNY